MSVGRPREFDADVALDRAMEVFWAHGYEGATLPELTKAMGINRPSLYATFGNKETLFRKAMERYAQGPADYIREALSSPTAREAVERLLNGAATLMSEPGRPKGCFAVQGALACGEGAEAIRLELAARRAAGLQAIQKRLEQGRAAEELPTSVNCEDLARYFTTVLHGLAVQAAGGASREEMTRVAKIAMSAWPELPAT